MDPHAHGALLRSGDHDQTAGEARDLLSGHTHSENPVRQPDRIACCPHRFTDAGDTQVAAGGTQSILKAGYPMQCARFALRYVGHVQADAALIAAEAVRNVVTERVHGLHIGSTGSGATVLPHAASEWPGPPVETLSLARFNLK